MIEIRCSKCFPDERNTLNIKANNSGVKITCNVCGDYMIIDEDGLKQYKKEL